MAAVLNKPQKKTGAGGINYNEFKKFATSQESTDMINTKVGTLDSINTITTPVGPGELLYGDIWQKKMAGSTISKVRSVALKMFANINTDDEPYRALCRRSNVFARRIKDFDSTDDEGKKKFVPF